MMELLRSRGQVVSTTVSKLFSGESSEEPSPEKAGAGNGLVTPTGRGPRSANQSPMVVRMADDDEAEPAPIAVMVCAQLGMGTPIRKYSASASREVCENQ